MFGQASKLREVTDHLYAAAPWLDPRVTRFGDADCIVLNTFPRQRKLLFLAGREWGGATVLLDEDGEPYSYGQPEPTSLFMSSRTPARDVAAAVLRLVVETYRFQLQDHPGLPPIDPDQQDFARAALRRLTPGGV